MKKLYQLRGLWLAVFLLLVLGRQAQAQVNITDPAGGQPVCPGKEYLYGATTTGSSANCSYTWTVGTGGNIVRGQGTALVTVTWKDIPGPNSNATIKVTTSGCSTPGSNSPSPTLTVFVRSLSQTTPGGISGRFDYCSTNVTRIYIPRVDIPQPSGTAPVAASAYLWVIPAGWRYADGTVSDGSTAKLLNDPSAYSIQVTPTATGEGTITVRAADTACGSSNPTSTVSSTSNLTSRTTMRRPIITLTPTSKALNCGDARPFTVQASDSYFGATYTWSLPSGWSVSGTYPNYTLTPSGGSLNGIVPTFNAGYSCETIRTPLPIQFGSSLGTPVFTEFGDMCRGTTRRFAVAPVPGATSYTWQFPSFFPTPTITTTAPQVNVTSSTTQGGQSSLVSVSANSGSCPSSAAATKYFNSGVMAVRIITPYGSPTEVCQNTQVTYQAQVSNRPQVGGTHPLSYVWRVDGKVVGYYSEVTVLSPPPGQWTSIRVDVTDDCAFPGFDAVGLQSVSQINGQYCVIDGGPSSLAASPTTAYPNPANERLTVPLTKAQVKQQAEVRLYDGKGKLLLRVPADRNTIELNTRDLPNGLYQLETPGDPRPERQTIEIKH